MGVSNAFGGCGSLPDELAGKLLKAPLSGAMSVGARVSSIGAGWAF